MKLIGREIIESFKRKHSTSRLALDRWVKLMEGAYFQTPQDVKNLFGVNVDFVGKQGESNNQTRVWNSNSTSYSCANS